MEINFINTNNILVEALFENFNILAIRVFILLYYD